MFPWLAPFLPLGLSSNVLSLEMLSLTTNPRHTISLTYHIHVLLWVCCFLDIFEIVNSIWFLFVGLFVSQKLQAYQIQNQAIKLPSPDLLSAAFLVAPKSNIFPLLPLTHPGHLSFCTFYLEFLLTFSHNRVTSPCLQHHLPPGTFHHVHLLSGLSAPSLLPHSLYPTACPQCLLKESLLGAGGMTPYLKITCCSCRERVLGSVPRTYMVSHNQQ